MTERHAVAASGYTKGVAKFVSDLRYEAIPSEVLQRIKLLILDSFGCAIYGSQLEWSRILIATLGAVDTSRGCGVWGRPERFSAPHAALVNGTLVQSFELDDVHRGGILHVGAVTLPPLCAVVEGGRGITGRDFLRAAVAGYEVGPRVGMCMGQDHILQGWHSGATVGVFSAAAGAAAALRLPAERVAHALGIAGTQAAGLMAAQYGAMVKRMHAGRSAQSGLYGALLAERGFTGIADVFETPYGGFCTTFSGTDHRFNLTELTSGLGARFETLNISIKLYSCVLTNHTTLDGLKKIQARRPFKPDEIDRITVGGARVTVEHVGWPYKPDGVTAAQLNMGFCVATLLLTGDVFVDQFTEASIVDPARIALAEKLEVYEDPEVSARGQKFRHHVNIAVYLKDGTVLKETVENVRSFPTDAEVVGKFRKLAGAVLPASQVDRLCELVLGLEKEKDAAEVTRALGVVPN